MADIAEVVASWELPIAIQHEQAAAEAVSTYGSEQSLSSDDFALVLKAHTEAWDDKGTVHPHLRRALEGALKFTPPILEGLHVKSYLEMYTKLRTAGDGVAGLPYSTTRRLLARSSTVAYLLSEEQFSCSQVARLIAATESSLDVPHQAIAVIAKKLDLLPSLDSATAGHSLWTQDRNQSVELFPDSSLADTNRIAASSVGNWLPEADIESLLNCLSRPDQSNEPNWPYLQMLHWCLTPIEFYDHPASYLYEFSPRGQVARDLFANYPSPTGNPILNNAKAVQILNTTWARTRRGEDAHALVTLLGFLESLPFLPRRQVARVLRAWLFRLVDLCTINIEPISLGVTDQIFTAVTHYITANETNTQGVIEQRLVDCLAQLAFEKTGWRAKGLGDGVNDSNFSRHKLGDVEFTNVDERISIALEAHGGHLSSTYVTDHTRSLSRIIEQRLRESWAALDDPSAWRIDVIFVAHSRDVSDLPTEQTIHGVDVTYEYLDYSELVARACDKTRPADRIAAFESLVVDQLNASNVRESARDKFRAIVASTK